MWIGFLRFRTVVTLKHSFLDDKLRVPLVRLKILTQKLWDSTNLLRVIANRSLSVFFDVSEVPKSRTEYSETVWASHIVVRNLRGSTDLIFRMSYRENSNSSNTKHVIENRSLSVFFDVSQPSKSATEFSETAWAFHIVVRNLRGSKNKIWTGSCL